MFKLYGANLSPYSLKLRAILRYRRIPYIWISGDETRKAQSEMKAPVIPVLEFPDGKRMNDTTVLIDELEAANRERSIVPEDPGDAFLAFLIEDYADEWLTKGMFQYRWRRERDQERMSRWLGFDYMKGGGREAIEQFASVFKDRQVGRLPIVGSSPENYDLIEDTSMETSKIVDEMAADGVGMFGSRPSRAEFGLYGQISQFTVDPTPQELLLRDYPYAYRWIATMDDLSGVEGEWTEGSEGTPAVRGLLSLIGEIYLPFLAANAAALEAGADEVRLTLRGTDYRQTPFKYQAKCLKVLRERWAALDPAARERISPVLDETGCLAVLAS